MPKICGRQTPVIARARIIQTSRDRKSCELQMKRPIPNPTRESLPMPLVHRCHDGAKGRALQISLAQAWLVVTFSVVFGRVALLWYRYGFIVSMHWYVKFVTDPFTDVPAYWKSGYQVFNPTLLQGALHSSFPTVVPEPEGYVKPQSGYDAKKSN